VNDREMEAAFLADVLANPDDDAPRMAYSDWLMENGQEDRGAFISLQLHLARTQEGYALDTSSNWAVHDRSVVPEIREAAAALRRWVLKKTLGSLRFLASYAVWRRGFIEELRIGDAGPSDWTDNAGQLLARWPLRVVRVKTNDWPGTSGFLVSDTWTSCHLRGRPDLKAAWDHVPAYHEIAEAEDRLLREAWPGIRFIRERK